jgi:hypothetical protein
MKLSDIELNTFAHRESLGVERALTAALDAMVSYGSDSDHQEVIALLMVLAKQENHRHFRESEEKRSEGGAS